MKAAEVAAALVTRVAHCTVAGPGQVMVGGVVSLTVKVVVQEEVLLAASLTVTVIVVLPRPTRVPAVGLCVFVSEPGGLQLSVAEVVAVKSGTAA